MPLLTPWQDVSLGRASASEAVLSCLIFGFPNHYSSPICYIPSPFMLSLSAGASACVNELCLPQWKNCRERSFFCRGPRKYGSSNTAKEPLPCRQFLCMVLLQSCPLRHDVGFNCCLKLSLGRDDILTSFIRLAGEGVQYLKICVSVLESERDCSDLLTGGQNLCCVADVMMHYSILGTEETTLERKDEDLLRDGLCRQMFVVLQRMSLWEGQKSDAGVLSVNDFLQKG